jgi:uncharacterized protein
MIKVTGLYTYPVKSCAGISLGETPVTPRGLLYDRDFMLIDAHNRFVSQRQVSELALIRPTIAGDRLRMSAPGMPALGVPLARDANPGDRIEATVHEHPVVGTCVGSEYDEWFSAFLPPYGETARYRLLRVLEREARPVGGRYRRADASNELGFADSQPLLLASERSLAALNALMDLPVPMNRFRPNIVIDGPELDAYEEDHWTQLRLGELRAYVVKGCDRCAIPDVDQQTARTGKEVRRALVARRGFNAHDLSNTGVFFAQNLNHVYAPGTTVRVGDPVEVLERQEAPNVIITGPPPAAAERLGLT